MGGLEVPRGRARPALFRALGRENPPQALQVDGRTCHLQTIFKHDSWAATALYRRDTDQVICKFHRQQSILGLSMRWFGRWLARHEARLLDRLADVDGIPKRFGEVRVSGRRARNAVARAYIPGHPLRQFEVVDDSFCGSLERLVGQLHERRVVYIDLHKRENIIVGDNGRPYLIDFQISMYLPAVWPLTRVLDLLRRNDEYHLEKHKLRLRPDLCDFDAATFGRRRPWHVWLHRFLAVPFRTVRRRLFVLLRIRRGRGMADSEQFVEEALRDARPVSS